MSRDRTPHADAELRQRVLRYLRGHHVVTIATAEPWAAAVFYVNEGFRLYFLSSPRSRHAQHLARDARVAATVQEDYSAWPEVKGVQLEGRVHEVESSDCARVRELYATKFPIVASIGIPAAIVEALARIRWYRIDAQHVYFVDNSKGFGHRDAVDLGRQAMQG